MDKRKVDVAIIGAGTAGLTAYTAARKHTENVVLIEGEAYGTTCARVGCMPSKLLIAAADSAHGAARADMFGVAVAGISINGQRVLERVRRERDTFVGSVLASMGTIPESHRLMGRARFLAPGKLAVGDAWEVTAQRIVIATGASPHVPAMFQGLGDRLLTTDNLFELETLPASIAVFGAGAVGLELGQALSRLGVHVRLFGLDGILGGIFDAEIRDYAERCFSEAFYLDIRSEVSDLSPADNAVAITFTHRDKGEISETFERILVATGRPPNLEALDLHHSGLTLDDDGIPVTDSATLQCGDSPVFLVGDANGQLAVLHEAAQEGRIAGDNAGRYPGVQPAVRQVPLSIVFSHPQIASVGLPVGRMSDEERKAYAVATVSFEDQGRSKVMGENRGLLKVYARRDNGVFVGAEMVGPAAEHIGHLLAWAAQSRMPVSAMLAMPFYHPVVEEGVRTALKDLHSNLARLPAPEDQCLECGPGV